MTDDISQAHDLVTDVIVALAEAEGVEPIELDVTLADVIDPDALNALVSHPGSDWELVFEADGHTVLVTSDGAVHVDGVLHVSPSESDGNLAN